MSVLPVQGYLLDTHAVICAVARSSALSADARRAIAGGPNLISVVTYWEVILNSTKGAIDVGDPRLWWRDVLEQLAASALPLRPAHVSAVYGLPSIHKDPFHRLLIAQAVAEGLTLVSLNAEIAQYASADLRVIR